MKCKKLSIPPASKQLPQQSLVTPQPLNNQKQLYPTDREKNLISGAEEFKQRTLEPRVGVAAVLGVAGRPWESGGGGGLKNESVTDLPSV